MCLGIALWHGTPAHPQTQGKVERIHRTIAADAVGSRTFADLDAAQEAFTHVRDTYNLDRPHEALGFATPISRYTPSLWPFPETLPEDRIAPGDHVRTITSHGVVTFQKRSFFLGQGFGGHQVGVRPTLDPTRFTVHFGEFEITTIDLSSPEEAS